nr:MAG TPA: hypothetical protein [Caudoviricetes sp.]
MLFEICQHLFQQKLNFFLHSVNMYLRGDHIWKLAIEFVQNVKS